MEIQTIIIAIFASTGFWAFMTTLITSFGSRKKNIDKALKGLLHDKIYDNCIKYIDRGYVTVDELENLNYIYEPYRALGGNGTGESLYKEVQSLPKRNQNEGKEKD